MDIHFNTSMLIMYKIAPYQLNYEGSWKYSLYTALFWQF